jgi:hypothetical protein
MRYRFNSRIDNCPHHAVGDDQRTPHCDDCDAVNTAERSMPEDVSSETEEMSSDLQRYIRLKYIYDNSVTVLLLHMCSNYMLKSSLWGHIRKCPCRLTDFEHFPSEAYINNNIIMIYYGSLASNCILK